MHNFSRHNFYLKIGTLFHLIFDAFCCLIDYKNICVVLITRICRGILFHFQIGIFQVPNIWPQVTCTIYGLRYLAAGWTGWFVILTLFYNMIFWLLHWWVWTFDTLVRVKFYYFTTILCLIVHCWKQSPRKKMEFHANIKYSEKVSHTENKFTYEIMNILLSFE